MSSKENLAHAIIDHGWMLEGDFTLSSGRKSDYYINLRPMILNSRYVHLGLVPLIEYLTSPDTTGAYRINSGTVLCGVMTSGVPLVGSLLHRLSNVAMEVRSCIARTGMRDHGTKDLIEGSIPEGGEVIIIDDVATSGESILKTLRVLRARDINVRCAVVLVDRLQGAQEMLADHGLWLDRILTIDDLWQVKRKYQGLTEGGKV